ncbi:MAG: peptide chain release factor N(5)-glutamine methyltransferase [Candidatus Peribacteraceae bacterium]|nr:peptide chain release factor N(5)-glutamine methyltransferase [Candidatus Peribacteraceae bacterium]MDD5742849.1 peptide chain release factor N(5)-glutamine methyltransferase [Candidatus Peribacteraceae bacterium]
MTIDALMHASDLPRLEAEVLMSRALNRDRTWLLAHGDEEVRGHDREVIEDWCTRRLKGEPVAYITGEREFFGRTFRVTPAVMIPRPSTEELVRSAREFLDHPQPFIREADAGIVIVSRVLRPSFLPQRIVDVGTGSGCIAVTLALECPELKVIATDVSAEALNIARENATLHHVDDRVRFFQGTDLEPVRDLQEPFLLVANPPYIPDGTVLEHQVADYEPHAALFAGSDGGDVLRILLRQAREHPFCAGIVCECQTNQSIWFNQA